MKKILIILFTVLAFTSFGQRARNQSLITVETGSETQGIDSVLTVDSVASISLQVPVEAYSEYDYYNDSTVMTKKDFRNKILTMPHDYNAGLVLEKSADLITTPHGSCMKGDIIFVGNRVGTATIVRFNDPSDLTSYDTQSFTGYDRLECLVYDSINDMIYGTLRASGDNFIRLLEIDPDALGTYTIRLTSVEGASTPALTTDNSYVYVGAYAADPKISKISVSTWAAVDSVTLTGWTGVHSAAMSVDRGEAYFGGGGGTDSIAIVDISDMSYVSVDVSSYLDGPTDDLAYYENETDTVLFIQGERPGNWITGGIYAGAKIDLSDNSVVAAPFYPGYGVFINDNLMTVSNVNYLTETGKEGLQMFSLENLDLFGDFTKLSLEGYDANEIFITSSGLVLFTDFSTNNGVLFRLNSSVIPQDNYNPATGVTSVTAGDGLTGGGTGAVTLNLNLGTLANDATATTADYIPWIDAAEDNKMTISTLASLIGAGGTSPWTEDANGITYGAGNVGVGIASNSGIGLYHSQSLAGGLGGNITNTSTTGNGFATSSGSSTGSYYSFLASSGLGELLKVRADGEIFAPEISNNSQDNIVGYNSTTGQLTYFDAVSYGTSTQIPKMNATNDGFAYQSDFTMGTTLLSAPFFKSTGSSPRIYLDNTTGVDYTLINESDEFIIYDETNTKNIARFSEAGKATFDLYGSGTFTGTGIYNAAINATGEIIEKKIAPQSLSGTSVSMDFRNGAKASISLTGATTLTITNMPDGEEGQIEVTNPSTHTLNINGSTGYTTEQVMGTNASIQSSDHTTVVYWRSGATLYYGFIYDN